MSFNKLCFENPDTWVIHKTVYCEMWRTNKKIIFQSLRYVIHVSLHLLTERLSLMVLFIIFKNNLLYV